MTLVPSTCLILGTKANSNSQQCSFLICPWLLVSLLASKPHCDGASRGLLEAGCPSVHSPSRVYGSFSWMFSVSTGVYAFGFLFMLPQLFVNYKVGLRCLC